HRCATVAAGLPGPVFEDLVIVQTGKSEGGGIPVAVGGDRIGEIGEQWTLLLTTGCRHRKGVAPARDRGLVLQPHFDGRLNHNYRRGGGCGEDPTSEGDGRAGGSRGVGAWAGSSARPDQPPLCPTGGPSASAVVSERVAESD